MATKKKATTTTDDETPAVKVPQVPRRRMRLEELAPAPYNDEVRTIPKKNAKALRESLSRFGVVDGIVWNERTGHLVGGHKRRDELLGLGEAEADVAVVDLDEDEEQALSLALNNPGAQGEFTDKAAGIVAALAQRRGDLVASLALSAVARRDAVGQRLGPGKSHKDTTPAHGGHRVLSQPGELYELGPHRLLCGDATSREDMDRLMGNDLADLWFSDPPYGVVYGQGSGTQEKNAIRGDLSQATIPISFSLALDHLDDNARIYLCGGSTNVVMFFSLFDHHLHQMPKMIIWDKGQFIMRPNNYHSQFEVVFFGWKGKGGGPEFWYGDRKASDVWGVERDHNAERVHPTQKPVEIPARAIRYSCPPGGLVLETFGGSGSTLIAAEQEGRRSRVMELDPKFCDVIRKRWGMYATEKGVDPGPGALL